jgi:hypothetical protein
MKLFLGKTASAFAHFVRSPQHSQAATRARDTSRLFSQRRLRLIVVFRDSRLMNTRVTVVSYLSKSLHYADRLAVAQAAIAQRRRRSNHDTSTRDQSRVSLIRVFDT